MTGCTCPEGSRPNLLVVVSHRHWIADDLAKQPVLPVVHDHGMDLPDLPAEARPAWWMPTEHAARLIRAGLDATPLSTGPSWLSTVPEALTGRTVWTGPLSELRTAPRAGWCKPAEAKLEHLPAAWWSDVDRFAAAARALDAPDGMQVQVSPVRLDLDAEYRCFVVAGKVAAVSPYLISGRTWDLGIDAVDRRWNIGWDTTAGQPTEPSACDAVAFAEHVTAVMAGRQPEAYVLDVAVLTDGSWAVVEGNPAWSSNPYNADPHGVVETVRRASSGPGNGFRWAPDPWLTRYAERRPLLRPAVPSWWPRISTQLADHGTCTN